MNAEERAAHMARLAFMEQMGLGHWSITDPVVCVRMFRKYVQRQQREEDAQVAERIAKEADESTTHGWVGHKIAKELRESL